LKFKLHVIFEQIRKKDEYQILNGLITFRENKKKDGNGSPTDRITYRQKNLKEVQ